MGTRADFYAGRGPGAEWLGSIAWDGYPSGGPAGLLRSAAVTEPSWRQGVYQLLVSCGDTATAPDHGWPWPWDDSGTTDYAYALDGGVVWCSNFGLPWFAVDSASPTFGEPREDDEPAGERAVFPDMSRFRNITMGRRSGLIVFGGLGDEGAAGR